MIQHRKNRIGKWLGKVVTTVATAAALFGVTTPMVQAATGVSVTSSAAFKVHTANNSTTIHEKFLFVPVFTSETQVTGSGGSWVNRDYSPTHHTKWLSQNFNNRNDLKNKTSVKYTNVGVYNGKKVDLVITLAGWTKAWGTSGNISFAKDRISMTSQGYTNVNMRWTFYEAGTNKELKVAGYMTFIDVDEYQGIEFTHDTHGANDSSGKIERIHVPTSNTKLRYIKNGTNHRYYNENGVNAGWGASDANQYEFTAMFSNTSALGITWYVDHNQGWLGNANNFEESDYNTNYAGGAEFLFGSGKPGRTNPPKPSKSVNETSTNHGKAMTYTITHNVPKEPKTFFYVSYVLSDVLDNALDLNTAKDTNGVKIVDEAGNNRTGWFDITYNDRTVKASAKSSTLDNSNFYGHQYRMTIQTTVNGSRLTTTELNRGKIPNKASVYVNRPNQTETKWSDPIDVPYPFYSVTVIHRDNVTKSELGRESELYMSGESYSYSPKATGTYKTSDNNKWNYRGVTGTLTGTVSSDLTLYLEYERPWQLTIKHVDNTDNSVIKTETAYNSGAYNGTTFAVKGYTDLKTSSGDTYRLLTGEQKGTINGNTTITFMYTRPRTLTIRHIDADDNKVLATSTDKKYDGDSYSYAPRTDLKTSGGDAYKAIDGTMSGKVNGDQVITIRYTKPRTITVKYIDIDDNKVIATDVQPNKLYDGATYATPTRTDLKTSGGDVYRYEKGPTSGTVNGNMTVEQYYSKPRVITVNHVDNDDSKVIKTETITPKPYDRAVVDVKHRTDLKTAGGDAYKPVTPDVKVTVNGNQTVEIRYTKPRLLTIQHIDDDTDDIITTDTMKLYDGEAYKHVARTDLKFQGVYIYKALAPKEHTGITNGDQTFKFRYTKPSLAVGLKEITIKTDKVENGLPVTLSFDYKELAANRWKDNDLIVKVYNASNQIVYSKTYKVEDAKPGIAFTIPKEKLSGLAKGSKQAYKAVIETPNVDKMVILPNASTIDTDGYIASETIVTSLSVEDVSTVNSWTGVAMTSRKLGQNIVLTNETASISVGPTVHTMTGYGYEPKINMTFHTTLTDALPTFSAAGLIDPEIAEGDYGVENSRHKVPLTLNAKDSSKNGGRMREANMVIPRLYADKKTATLTVTANADTVDAGHKFYVPIWLDVLDTYQFDVVSQPVGRNAIVVKATQNVSVDAYMFGHIDSDTLKYDAILIQPAQHQFIGTDRFEGR